MFNRVFLIVGLIFASVFTVGFLFLLSYDYRNHLNGFERQFSGTQIQLFEEINLQYNSYYIAGKSSNKIYLGNTTAPSHILIIDTSSTDTSHLAIDVQKLNGQNWVAPRVTVVSPYFFIIDGNVPVIFRGSLKDLIPMPIYEKNIYFTEVVPIDSTLLVFKVINDRSEYVLAKKRNNSAFVKFYTEILEKQIDGIFCSEGVLHYDVTLNHLIYLYAYRNEFICMDTSLNVVYRKNTIDTISRAQVKVSRIRNDQSSTSITLSAPPLIVNNISTTSGESLFVNSRLIADNEKKEDFEKSSVIDVYDLKTGNYQFSFYLPTYNGHKLKHFVVLNNKVFALYNEYLVVFKIDLQIS